MPPLLGQAGAELIERIGTLDSGLLLLLGNGRIVPPQVWDALPAREAQ